ncbi:WXG100 family type VII secretion target [Nocardioides sp. MH1]|uniref:WXG100 family type VII secretion target n=1 Tax=Nocardioides sp. MH1 TaxID=3242490 RepID=UPI0035217043
MAHPDEFGQGAGTLSRASGLVSDARDDFTSYSARLDGQIASVQGRWGGRGAQAFFVLHQAWTEKQRTIVDALDEFASSLTSTEHDNTATDDQVGASYGQLSARLG